MPSSITLTVKHLPTSTSFFLSALQPLDYVYRGRIENTIGFGLKDLPPDFWISQETPGVLAGAAHVAFPAVSQSNVNEFFIAALKAGGKCHGEPALRDPTSGYFSAAVIDFDGNSIEAVYRPDLLDEGYGSRPSSTSSVSSVKSKQPTMASKAPTMVSRASTTKPFPSETRSLAPSQTSRAPTLLSKASTSASKSPTQVSRAPTSASRAPTAVPSQASRAPSQRTAVSRTASDYAPFQNGQVASASPPQTVTQTTPSGEVVTTLITEARGAFSVARDLVNQVRPALDSANSAPNIHAASPRPPSDPNSHKPSDTIVGTLLGVAAGAALHYAYTKATEGDQKREQEFVSGRPNIARTNTAPSLEHENERLYYYHEYDRAPTNQPYAIEAPPSAYSYNPSQAGSQRYITMEDNAERLSDYAPSQWPRRRSSFSGVDVRSFASKSRASQDTTSRGGRALEAPPTSYRAPTAVTQMETESRASGRSRSKSRVSSMIRANSVSSDSKASRRSSRHRSSDDDLRSKVRSTISRVSSAEKSEATTVKPVRAPSEHSKAPSRAPSEHSKAPSRAPSERPKAPSRAPSRSSTIRPEDKPLPASRAGTTVSASPSDYHSTHSKANRTVIGKMLDRERQGARSELTKSVVGKIEEVDRLNVTNKEVDPSDSVSQVSSVRSKRSSKR